MVNLFCLSLKFSQNIKVISNLLPNKGEHFFQLKNKNLGFEYFVFQDFRKNEHVPFQKYSYLSNILNIVLC